MSVVVRTLEQCATRNRRAPTLEPADVKRHAGGIAVALPRCMTMNVLIVTVAGITAVGAAAANASPPSPLYSVDDLKKPLTDRDKEVCASFATEEARASRFTRTPNLVRYRSFGCKGEDLFDTSDVNNVSAYTPDFLWHIDRPGAISEIDRMLWVHDCLWPSDNNPQKGKPETSVWMSRYATCGFDARRLDRKKFDAEVRALGLGPAPTAWIYAYLAETLERIEQFRSAYEQPKLKPYRDTLIDVPEAAVAAWMKEYEASRVAFDELFAVEDALARAKSPPRLSCDKIFRPKFRELIQANKPRKQRLDRAS
jgi:hypothetical protein